MSFLKALQKSEPYRGTPTSQLIVHKPSPPDIRRYRSAAFDAHRVVESSQQNKGPRAISLQYDERGRWGFDISQKNPYGQTPRERKETLFQIYCANPWASSCIETIGLYIASGGYVIEPTVPNPDEEQRDEIKEFLLRVNDDWDFSDYVYDAITDKLIFGETFTEYTMYKGTPYQLFPTDCISIDTDFDAYGRIVQFKQQLNSTTQINYLNKDTMVRWWLPSKRAKVDAFSPFERMCDAIYLDKQMVNWSTTFFRNGGKWDYYFKGLADEDEADRYMVWAEENWLGAKNRGRIPATWGETEIAPLANGKPLDMDYDKGLDRTQSIVLATLHVPPALACIAESGNKLTDVSEEQLKIFRLVTCNAHKRSFFDKFNFRFITPYWPHYRVDMAYADLRSDEGVAKIEDMRVRNGTRTIDEIRQEGGKEPYTDGSGSIPVIVTTKEVTPVPRLKDLETEQRETAQVTLDTAKANADLAKTKAKQAKEPQQPEGAPNNQNGQDQKEAPEDKGKVQQDDEEAENEGQNQGEQGIQEHGRMGILDAQPDLSKLSDRDRKQYLYVRGQQRGCLCLSE